MRNVNIESSVKRATAWSFAAEISAKLIVPITNIILARLLAPEAFGIIATINIVISFAETFTTSGFQRYIIQHDFSDNASLNRSCTVAFWSNLFISIIAWILIALFSNKISVLVGCSGYEIPLIIASLSLPLNSLSSVHEGLFQRKLEYKVLFVRRLVVCFLPFIITVPLAFLGAGYWSLIIGSISGSLAKIILLSIAIKWRPSFYYSFKLLRNMFSFGIWNLLESIAMWAGTYIDILIISNSLGDYYTGLYKMSQSTVTGILSIITGATTSVLFASLSRIQNDEENFNKVFYSFQNYVSMLVLPIGVGIFFYRELITSVLLGSQWMEACNFIGIWGLCTALVCAFGTFSREIFRAKGRPELALVVQLIHIIFVIPICYHSVAKGFHFLSYSRSLAYLQVIIVRLLFAWIFYRISPFKIFIDAKPQIFASILMGVFAWLFLKFLPNNTILQLIEILFCALIYFIILFIIPESNPIVKKMYFFAKEKILKLH